MYLQLMWSARPRARTRTEVFWLPIQCSSHWGPRLFSRPGYPWYPVFFSIHYIIICGFLTKSSNCCYLLRRHLAPYDFSLPVGQSPLTFFHFWEHLVHQNPWPTNLHDQSLSLTVKVRIKKITTLIQKFNFTDFQRSSRYQGNFFALKTKYWTYSLSSRPTWNQTKSCNEIL